MAKLSDQEWNFSGFIKRNWKPLFIPPALFLMLSAVATAIYTQTALLTSVGIGSVAGTLPFWWVIPVAGVILAATMLITQGLSLISKDKAILAMDYAATHWKEDFDTAEKCIDNNGDTKVLEYSFERQHRIYNDLPTNSSLKTVYKDFVSQTLFNRAAERGNPAITALITTETAKLNQFEKF